MSSVRSFWRRVRRQPGLASAVVVTLAVVLGSVTAIASVTHAWLLRPLPFPDADRVVLIQSEVAGKRGHLALREFRELERESRAFAAIGAYYRTQYNLTGDGPPQALTCTMPSAGVFEVLGVTPLYGDIWPSSIDFTRHYNVVLSHALWQQRFGGRPDLVGQSIVLDGASYVVSGVLPDGVDFPLQTDVYRGVTDYNAPDVRRYSVIARLASGRTLADVESQLDALAMRFATTWPDSNAGVRLVATPIREAYVGRSRPFVLLMAAGVALLVVIATLNVGNLLLSRALAQEGEIAVRLALGASRWRVAEQGFVDASILTVAGMLPGALGAGYAVDAATVSLASDLPPWMSVRIDVPVLLLSSAVAAIVTVSIAALPALHGSRTDIDRVLRQHAGRTGSIGHAALRRWLVGIQAATASLLLVTAGVFASGLSALLSIEPGFDSENVLTFRVDPPYSRYGEIASSAEFYRRAAEALEQMPGVAAVGANTNLPFARLEQASPRVTVEGHQSGRADEAPFVNLQLVDPGYFAAMRIPLIAGRRFELTDDEAAPLAAIVSERAARHFWGGDDPLGRRFRLVWNQSGRGTAGGSELWLTVVGVVGAVRFGGVEDVAGFDVYAPHRQMFAGDTFFVVRTAQDPGTFVRQLRYAIDAVDRDQSYFDVATLADRISTSLWPHRVATLVLTFFAAVALLLAVVGTYAVTAHGVAAERREIGIHRALGASSRGIVWLVARQWTMPVAVGVLMGLALGRLAARLLLTTIGAPADPVTWPFLLPGVLTVAAAAACALPVALLLRRLPLAAALRGEQGSSRRS